MKTMISLLVNFAAGLIAAAVLFALDIFMGISSMTMVNVVMDIILIILLVSVLPKLKEIQRQSLSVPIILLVLSGVLALIVHISGNPYDLYHYIVSIAVLLAAFWMTFELITLYNLQTTRPMPGFYDRKGGKNDAKD